MVIAKLRKRLSDFDRLIKQGEMIVMLSFYPKVDLEGWK